MAQKEHLKKAVALPGGGYEWAWDGTNGVHHTVTWHKNGETFWTVSHGDLVLRTEQPWFLVKIRGEVQENIRHFRTADLDTITANRALVSAGMAPDQHTPLSYCTCINCIKETS